MSNGYTNPLDTLAPGWRVEAGESLADAMIAKGETAADDAGRYDSGTLSEYDAAKIVASAWIDAATAYGDTAQVTYSTACELGDALSGADWFAEADSILAEMGA